MHDTDLSLIRHTARYGLACVMLNKLQLESARRVRLRRCRHPVAVVAIWLNAGLQLERADEIDEVTFAVALADCGFALELRRGELRTDCSAEAMHRYGRLLRDADAPRYPPDHKVEFPYNPRWAERLARLDLELSAGRALH